MQRPQIRSSTLRRNKSVKTRSQSDSKIQRCPNRDAVVDRRANLERVAARRVTHERILGDDGVLGKCASDDGRRYRTHNVQQARRVPKLAKRRSDVVKRWRPAMLCANKCARVQSCPYALWLALAAQLLR